MENTRGVDKSNIVLMHKPKIFGKSQTIDTSFLNNKLNVGCKLQYAVACDYLSFLKTLQLSKPKLVAAQNLINNADSLIKQLGVIHARGNTQELLLSRELRAWHIEMYGGTAHFAGTPENTEKFLIIIRTRIYKQLRAAVAAKHKAGTKVLVPSDLLASMAFDNLKEAAVKVVVKANALSPSPIEDVYGVYDLIDKLVNQPLDRLCSIYAWAKHIGATCFASQKSADNVLTDCITDILENITNFVFLTDKEIAHLNYYDINRAFGFIKNATSCDALLEHRFGIKDARRAA